MDKANSPYSINSLGQFLSTRAIERRQKQAIAIAPNDIPVNQSYINRVREYPITILTRSKWFNGVTIYCLYPSYIDTILQLPFVKCIISNEYCNYIYDLNSVDKIISEEVLLKENIIPSISVNPHYNGNDESNYGPSIIKIIG